MTLGNELVTRHALLSQPPTIYPVIGETLDLVPILLDYSNYLTFTLVYKYPSMQGSKQTYPQMYGYVLEKSESIELNPFS